MFYIYYLKSTSHSGRAYIGHTRNLEQALADHNAGKSIRTAQFKPWKIVGLFGFDTEIKAIQFERHLKTTAGRIFLKRYFDDGNSEN